MSDRDYSLHTAEELGLDAGKLDALLQRAQRGLQEGPLPTLQLALAKDDRLALFTTLDADKGVVSNRQRYNIFSCVKPLVASAIWKLMGENKLGLQQRATEFIAGFAENGKDAITVEQLLCHTAGIPNAPLGPPDWFTRQGRLDKMASWRLNWEPGSRMEYHSTSAHWALAEIIENISGIDYRDYILQSILQPLGLENLRLGVPENQQDDIAELIPVGKPPTPEEMEKLVGVAIQLPEISDASLLKFNQPEVRALGVPGAGGISNAADVALFYQALLHNKQQLWNPAILADATGNVRVTFDDPTNNIPANRSIGLVIGGDDGLAFRRGMGKSASPKTFGHRGVGGQVAWADPVSGISFCLLTNGLDANPVRSIRFCNALSSYAGDCGA